MQCAVGDCADVFGEVCSERAVVRFNLGCDDALRLECARRLLHYEVRESQRARVQRSSGISRQSWGWSTSRAQWQVSKTCGMSPDREGWLGACLVPSLRK